MTKSQARAKVNEAISWHQSTHVIGIIALLVLFGTSLLHINVRIPDANGGTIFLLWVGWIVSLALIAIYMFFAVAQLQRDETTQLIDDAIYEHIKTLPEKESESAQSS